MKKLYLLLFFVPITCPALDTKQSEKIKKEEIIELKQRVADLDKKMDTMMGKIDELYKQSLSIKPIVPVKTEQSLEPVDTTEEQSVKKSKISWGKRANSKTKAVEKKMVDKKIDEKEESIADADDDQGGD